MNERVEYSQLDCYKRATDEQKKKLNQEQYFDLGKLPEETLRKEFENYIRYRGTKVSILTIKTERNYFNSLCEFLQKPSNQVKSLMERDENVWIKQLKAWMLQKGRALTKAKKRVYQNESVEKVALIRYFENIIQFTVDLSETNELIKDIWYLERLPIIIRSSEMKEVNLMDMEKMKKDLGGGAVFELGEENVAFAKYFTGECYLNMLTTERVPVGLVTFAPKTINAFHVHHKGGQILLVTGGRGWYQEEGKPARELKAGDVVNIPPEVKHWHGAAKDSWFQHIAVEVPAEGASNEWLEFLPEEEYNKLK